MHARHAIRRIVPTLIASSLTLAQALAQQPAGDAGARFEAVSIKRHEPGTPQGYRDYPGGRIVSQGQTTVGLIARAYGLRGTRPIGRPEWIRSDFYTVETLRRERPARQSGAGDHRLGKNSAANQTSCCQASSCHAQQPKDVHSALF